MKVLFIADQFDDENRDEVSPYPGGAELTDSALIESCPFSITKIKFSNLEKSDFRATDIVVIGNSKNATGDQLEYISSTKKYILFEHDMRICRYDGDFSRAKKEPIHYFFKKCICPHFYLKRLYSNSLGAVFLTNRQYEVYKNNPFFKVKRMEILGCSAFNLNFFEGVDSFREKRNEKSGTAVFYSPHPVKGYEQSKKYCIDRGVVPVEIFNKTPEEVYTVFENAEQFVYLPAGMEWAGRMPVEARFLGCKVIINENVGVGGEPWWEMDERPAYEFVKDTPSRFWRIVENLINENLD